MDVIDTPVDTSTQASAEARQDQPKTTHRYLSGKPIWYLLAASTSLTILAIVSMTTVWPIIGDQPQPASQQPTSASATPTQTQTTPTETKPSSAQITLYTIANKELQRLTSFTSGDQTNQLHSSFDNQGNVYFLGDHSIQSYNLDSRQQQTVYHYEDLSYRLADLTFGDEFIYPNLYLSAGQDNYITRHHDIIDSYNLSTKQSHVIGPFEPVMYGDMKYLFHTTMGDDVVGTFGGDDCAGYGRIDLFKDNTSTKIIETGGGCNLDPRYISYLKDQDELVLLSVIDQHTDSPPESFKLDKLYAKDVYTGEEKTLYDFSAQPNNLDYSYTRNNLLYLVFTNREVWRLDLSRPNEITKFTVNKDLDIDSGWDFYGQYMYQIYRPIGKDDDRFLVIANPATGQSSTYDLNLPSNGINTVKIVGFWHDQPLITWSVSRQDGTSLQ
jgi:hypothetical protein